MKLAHVALWCRDLDRATAFWVEHFDAQPGERYASTRRPGFVSRFVKLDEGATLELMSIPGLAQGATEAAERPGWAHVAIALGSQAAVDAMAARMAPLGLLASPPRWTGDGFYEAVIRDPEGNPVEVTA
ncbi:MAG: VOC family protein [Propionivibrio sp.]